MKKLFALLLVCSLVLGASSALAAVSPLEDPSVIPETTEEGFLPEGVSPYYFKDHAAGYWFYLDQTVRIEIMRARREKFRADIEAGEQRIKAEIKARKNK